jgi:two-component system response regulator CpxR
MTSMVPNACQDFITQRRENCQQTVKVVAESGCWAKFSRQMKVLVIDDDAELCQLIADYLSPLGFEVEKVHCGLEGVSAANGETWHAIILDVMLPDIDGFEVLKRVRAKGNTPVLMLTGRGEEVDRIVGLELGADDYLPKTFSSRELLARLRAVIRRAGWVEQESGAAPEREIVVGSLRVNPDSHRVTLEDAALDLTPAEFAVLLALAKARGRVQTREQLIEDVAQREWDVFDRAIDMHVSTLRRKLKDDPREPRFIKTVRGYGYQLLEPRY